MLKENNKQSKEEKLVWEEGSIILTGCVAGLGEEKTKKFTKELLNALEKTNGKGKVLIDATASGGKATTSSEQRKIYVEFGKKSKAEKIAVFGINIIQRVVAEFIMKAIGKKTNLKEVKFFKAKEEAVKWLKEK